MSREPAEAPAAEGLTHAAELGFSSQISISIWEEPARECKFQWSLFCKHLLLLWQYHDLSYTSLSGKNTVRMHGCKLKQLRFLSPGLSSCRAFFFITIDFFLRNGGLVGSIRPAQRQAKKRHHLHSQFPVRLSLLFASSGTPHAQVPISKGTCQFSNIGGFCGMRRKEKKRTAHLPQIISYAKQLIKPLLVVSVPSSLIGAGGLGMSIRVAPSRHHSVIAWKEPWERNSTSHGLSHGVELKCYTVISNQANSSTEMTGRALVTDFGNCRLVKGLVLRYSTERTQHPSSSAAGCLCRTIGYCSWDGVVGVESLALWHTRTPNETKYARVAH
ncbi:unnamed protein product [Prunus armeniaca]|uniref:Uncharacterized protein n=1 Tax=Prunus armeniaca TaxID=36596 RepID=A0A6J5Y1H4_PRUAR|nr:unnamed protein product [Prunus armeniaca]